MKTSELTGFALDWAVATIDQPQWTEEDIRWNTYDYCDTGDEDDEPYSPSTNWAQGGPIIALESIYLIPNENADGWFAHKVGCNQSDYNGPTPLVAAMRAYVASVLGDEVEVPDELL